MIAVCRRPGMRKSSEIPARRQAVLKVVRMFMIGLPGYSLQNLHGRS